MRRLAAALITGLALATAPLQAQQQPAATIASPVLVVDLEAAFSNSMFGKRVVEDYNAAAVELEAENRRIAEDLLAEEGSLTERRPVMDPEVFRNAAAEFDTRVQGIRQAQDTKERQLQSMIAAGRDEFLTAVEPVLAGILREMGAVVILDARTVLMRIESIDITSRLVQEADRLLGDGAPDEPPAN